MTWHILCTTKGQEQGAWVHLCAACAVGGRVVVASAIAIAPAAGGHGALRREFLAHRSSSRACVFLPGLLSWCSVFSGGAEEYWDEYGEEVRLTCADCLWWRWLVAWSSWRPRA